MEGARVLTLQEDEIFIIYRLLNEHVEATDTSTAVELWGRFRDIWREIPEQRRRTIIARNRKEAP